MNEDVARKLAELNTRFYAQQAASFSKTRQSAWTGWQRVAQLLARQAGLDGAAVASGDGPEAAAAAGGAVPEAAVAAGGAVPQVRVLDLACGNMRFERFLLERCPQVDWRFFALDNCVPLALGKGAGGKPGAGASSPGDGGRVYALGEGAGGACGDPDAGPQGPELARSAAFAELDAVGSLLDGTLGCDLAAAAGQQAEGLPDAAVCFGFFHHVAGFERRVELLRALLGAVRPGGLVAVSLWRFMAHPKLAEKAQVTTQDALQDLPWLNAADLEPHDYVLGWQDAPGAYRYCHHFDAAEVERLLAAVPFARLEARFLADGRTNDLNHYLILRRM